jgi:hypothetical protein
MAKRNRQARSPAHRPHPTHAAVGRRAKIWLATISTVVGVATGMFTLRDQVFPGEAGSAGAMSTSAYEEHVGRICDEVNDNDRRRAHEDSKLRDGLIRAKTTLAQRNALLDPVRRTVAHDGHALAVFNGLEPPKALVPVRRDTQLAWNRNLARLRGYALRLDGVGTRAQLLAAIDHLSTLRPLLAADRVKLAAGLERLGGAECDLEAPRVTATFTLPAPRGHKPKAHADEGGDHAPVLRKHPSGANTPSGRDGGPGSGHGQSSANTPGTASSGGANTPGATGGGGANTPGAASSGGANTPGATGGRGANTPSATGGGGANTPGASGGGAGDG